MKSSKVNQVQVAVSQRIWEELSRQDKDRYRNMRKEIEADNQEHGRNDPRIAVFADQIGKILRYVDCNHMRKQERAIFCGICVAGPFLCANTRQLHDLLGKCKSSINGQLQHLGYLPIRTKTKTKQCLEVVLPRLSREPDLLKQWTVRVIGENASLCFVSSFKFDAIPNLSKDDIDVPDTVRVPLVNVPPATPLPQVPVPPPVLPEPQPRRAPVIPRPIIEPDIRVPGRSPDLGLMGDRLECRTPFKPSGRNTPPRSYRELINEKVPFSLDAGEYRMKMALLCGQANMSFADCLK